MTNSQERLIAKLTRLNGNQPPIRKWKLDELINELLTITKRPNISSVKLDGTCEARFVFDALVGAGFKISVNEAEGNFEVIW
jgi:hypothetical protein